MENQFVVVSRIPGNEGSDGTIVAETEEKFIKNHTIGSSKLRHGNDTENPLLNACGGNFNFISIPEQKEVLVCNRCFLRVSFPPRIITLGPLQKYLERPR